MNPLELDREIGKMARAMMSRNRQIGIALIAHLGNQLTPKDVAGVLIVSIERLIWFDRDSVIWAIENLIPTEVMREIQSIISVTVYKQLVAKGLVPGRDMSIDANGKLLLKESLKTAA